MTETNFIWKEETRSELRAFVSFQVYPEGRNEERKEEERQKSIEYSFDFH